MDAQYYVDSRLPFGNADFASVTLATTFKNIPVASATAPNVLPANYWWPGKVLRLTANLKITTGTTPGNFQFGLAYGSADAPACNVATVARAAVASITTDAYIVGYAQCRTTGTSGTLSMWGFVLWDLAGQLSTNQPNVFPSGGVTVVSTIDTTATGNGVYFQANRSGSTAEAIVVTNQLIEAMN